MNPWQLRNRLFRNCILQPSGLRTASLLGFAGFFVGVFRFGGMGDGFDFMTIFSGLPEVLRHQNIGPCVFSLPPGRLRRREAWGSLPTGAKRRGIVNATLR